MWVFLNLFWLWKKTKQPLSFCFCPFPLISESLPFHGVTDQMATRSELAGWHLICFQLRVNWEEFFSPLDPTIGWKYLLLINLCQSLTVIYRRKGLWVLLLLFSPPPLGVVRSSTKQWGVEMLGNACISPSESPELMWSVWGFSQCLSWKSVIKYKEQFESLPCIRCVQEKGVLILLCRNLCREVVVVGGQQNLQWLCISICQGSWCQVLLLWLRMVLFASPLASSHTCTLFICCCRQFKLLCYAFRGHAFQKWRERTNSIQTVGLSLNSYSLQTPSSHQNTESLFLFLYHCVSLPFLILLLPTCPPASKKRYV